MTALGWTRVSEVRIRISSGLRDGGWKGAMASAPDSEAATRELRERASSGDPAAFAELFGLHRQGVERLCRRMLDDASSAEDATSEVFLRARRSIANVDPQKPLGPWLRTVASNYCVDQLRRRNNERSLFSGADFLYDDLADPSPGVLTQITDLEQRRCVLDALDTLDAKYRLPLVLRFYQELDYDAMAEVLGVTRNQVGTLLFRAKKKLRQRLTEDPEVQR